jgi:hypothetical protein
MLAVANELNVELGGFYLNRESNENVDDPDNIVRLRGIDYTFSELSKLMQEGRYNEIPYNFLEDVVQPSNITIKDMMDVGNFMPKTKKAEDSFCDEEAMLEIVSQDAAGIEPLVKAKSENLEKSHFLFLMFLFLEWSKQLYDKDKVHLVQQLTASLE